MMADIATLDLEAAADLLRALAHPVRLSLLRTLIDGERSVGEIEQIANVVQPGLSQQLGVLRKADLVQTRREAKLVFYRINQARIAEVSALLDAFAGTVAISRADAVAARLQAGGGAAMFARITPRK
ncbi:ArsR/SmtB family transcription factor [Sphingobium sp. UBA5915]|uniref:ArsR/SmtB family transcription factor n=1 Tax=Sphingobium sp. UBA5915 TaxID=1947530 RepID=UPI0025D96E9C|nr:metalloregulator ArsR/SmtB family transcription factor [Sphingobium sp. UBA5915]